METSWISSIGSYTVQFEEMCARYLGIEHAVGVCNGTVALHLALHCLDIGPGDEVIVPTFTYIASVNAIAQTGARPVFVECRRGDWLIDPADVEAKITPRTKAIMPVHLYGTICDMAAIRKIADAHQLAIIEDCAEALGSTLNGQHVGTFGDIGTFSFFGNKTITTGEGGMVVARDANLAARMRKVKGQGQSLERRYWHDELGFNYRLTNICAAIGVAQMERIDQILQRKREIAQQYRDLLGEADVVFQEHQAGLESSEWLVSLLLPADIDRDELMGKLRDHGVDSRPVFYCAHHMPMYKTDASFPVSEEIARRGISLPSYPSLSDEDVHRVATALMSAL
jgi:perosamine synthetase